MTLSNSPFGAAVLCGGLLLGSVALSGGPQLADLRAAALRDAETFGTPHGVVRGQAKVVSFTTRFHGDPTARPLQRVEGKFRLEDFPYPSEGKHASVFFLRKGHYATHVSLRAEANGQDPNLGQIDLERIPKNGGAVVGVLAKVKRGPKHGIVSYEEGRVMIRSQDGRYVLELPSEQDGSFKAPLPPGIYELSTLDHFSKPKWVRVRPQRSTLAVLEVSEPLPQPGEEPPLRERD